jgi:FtsP/CotA-like multicopper oxidase with cupredoxin domain
MAFSRRSFLRGLVAAGGLPSVAAAQGGHGQHAGHAQVEATSDTAVARSWSAAPMLAAPGSTPVAVESPDVPKARFTLDGGVKVYRLIAEPVKTTFLPGRPVDCWGFNGSMPGPTVEISQGDRVRFIVENRLPEVFAMHWHGLEVPVEVDGVPGLGMDPIPPGRSYTFEFTVHQHGTFFYHSHMPMQELMGMIGLFIVHPRVAYEPRVHRDFGLIFQGWAILPNNTVPNTLAMEFNWLTINGKAGPATTPMIARLGERVRIRLVNLSMDHHPVHLHGNTFHVVATEAGRIPRAAWAPGNTALVGVAQARDIEFDAVYPGDWMLHCHLPHHMMNQMASMVGPLTDTSGSLPSGLGMEEGMGIIGQGHALSLELGPSLGRSLGTGNFAQPTPNRPLGEHAGHTMAGAPVSPDAHQVPGYPQDMWMVMDEPFAGKPETYGLRPTWSGGMMGMMTLVRVVRPELFDKIAELRAAQKGGRG